MRTTRLSAILLATCIATSAVAENGLPDPDATWMPKDVDWSQATEILVELSDNLFEPSELAFETGKPYRLVLRNVGHRPHDMVGEDFFHSIVLRRVSSDTGSVITPHVHSLYIQPKRETTVYFVPVKNMRAAFHCSLPGHREDGMEGEIVVE